MMMIWFVFSSLKHDDEDDDVDDDDDENDDHFRIISRNLQLF